MSGYSVPWPENDVNLLTDLFMRGYSDNDIGKVLSIPRTGQSVHGKRQTLDLTSKRYPDRPRPKTPLQMIVKQQEHISAPVTRKYTREENLDILKRYRKQEKVASIAESYGITTKLVHAKIHRLIDQESSLKLAVKTSRKCLRCRQLFDSAEPPKVNSICESCTSSIREMGSCMI